MGADVTLEPSWKRALAAELSTEYFAALTDFVHAEYETATVYPEPRNIFRALDACPLETVKVVILGQDPYHGVADGQPQAQGLSFSVPADMPLPPSLRNIFIELKADLDGTLRTSGDLSDWAQQGVLLLNATLTVRAGQAGSHQGQGWERFTDAIITTISQQRSGVVFILWGAYARSKRGLIDSDKHAVIESPHPSPLSAHRGFFGSRPFSRANEYLLSQNLKPIVWQ